MRADTSLSAWIGLAPSSVVAMDGEGRITSLNAAAERLLSTSAETAVGRPYTEVFGRSLADRVLGLFLRVARAGRPDAAQVLEASLPDGRRARLRATAGPVRDERGVLVGVLFVAEDRTAEAEAEREARERGEKEQRLRTALRRYTGEAIATVIEERPSFVGVGGTRQAVSVMHADVRGYTTVAEALEPEAVMELLRTYHGAAVAALQAEGGMIDRFIGDAILALWNAPKPQEDHVRLAVRGALAMVAATQATGADLEYGAGVHTGEAVVGNLGSDRYANYTAIGDTVNVAARLQSAAQAGQVICSQAAFEAAGHGLRATALGALTVKGRKNPVEAYRVDGLDE